ncbi:hypothetical protein L861_23240 [Litchfieldella anticariensis FP35 = DSM 16096]|uniref:ABC-2 type transporter domain-containing protein n=2 Tax=Litchfieldella anticariensis TaxID=258591 RepID=S2KM61_LITA3|nr:hypothetical protein L861_23240 [Halomonas anticariensis FP35 = DSM 16096]
MSLFRICGIFIKEQFKEPIQVFWIMLSPCLLFYFHAYGNGLLEMNYLEVSSWYYSYVAASVALFGFSFYIVGRRESGFIRSFVYTRKAKLLFLGAQFVSYLLVALVYFSAFYLATASLFDGYNLDEYFFLLIRFSLCFLFFCSFGIALSLLPLNFQNANTIISISLFSMIGLAFTGHLSGSEYLQIANHANPFQYAVEIMRSKTSAFSQYSLYVIPLYMASNVMGVMMFRVNPVWSRY